MQKVVITQLIYLNKGQEDAFNEFEKVALARLTHFNGKLLLRLKPNLHDPLESELDIPDEIHLVEFESEIDFENFKMDKERLKYLHLKEKSVKSIKMIRGNWIA